MSLSNNGRSLAPRAIELAKKRAVGAVLGAIFMAFEIALDDELPEIQNDGSGTAGAGKPGSHHEEPSDLQAFRDLSLGPHERPRVSEPGRLEALVGHSSGRNGEPREPGGQSSASAVISGSGSGQSTPSKQLVFNDDSQLAALLGCTTFALKQLAARRR